MSVPLPSVPGVHVRTCPGCGRETVVTDEMSRRVSGDSLIETREYDCPGCARPVRMRVPAWTAGSTTRDASRLGEWLARRADRAIESRRRKEEARERRGEPNG